MRKWTKWAHVFIKSGRLSCLLYDSQEEGRWFLRVLPGEKQTQKLIRVEVRELPRKRKG